MPILVNDVGTGGPLVAAVPESAPMDQDALTANSAKRNTEEDASAEVEYKKVMALARVGRAQGASASTSNGASGSESAITN